MQESSGFWKLHFRSIGCELVLSLGQVGKVQLGWLTLVSMAFLGSGEKSVGTGSLAISFILYRQAEQEGQASGLARKRQILLAEPGS